MLKVSYKIKGFTLNEFWFDSEVLSDKSSLSSLSCYRDSPVEIDSFLLKKEKKYTLISDLKESEEEIFSKFKANVRNEIRKFQKIKSFTLTQNYESKVEFIDFYSHFAKAKGLPKVEPFSIDKYKDNLFYISGYLEGRLTNMQVYLIDREGKNVRLLHSISTLYKEEYQHQHTQIGWINRYLHWHTMLHFKSQGFERFDWGGYSNNPNSPLAGIDKFKSSFGGKRVTLFNYYTLGYYALKTLQERIL